MASIGDALIFMTKATVLCLFLIGGSAGWLWWVSMDAEGSRLQLRVERARVADLGNKLNTCLAAASLPDGFALDRELKPWERYQGIAPGHSGDGSPPGDKG